MSGPKGDGTVYLFAEKKAGEWYFKVLEVETDDEHGRIKLLE